MLRLRYRRRQCWRAALALILIGHQLQNAGSSPTAAAIAATPSMQARLTPHSGVAERVIALVNRERFAAGCPTLTLDSALLAAARAHSRDMALHQFMNHVGSDGRTPAQRVMDAGYPFQKVAENVAAGRLEPEDIVQGWMESPGHRANILDCGLRDTGVGAVEAASDSTYGIYWTQLFGTRM